MVARPIIGRAISFVLNFLENELKMRSFNGRGGSTVSRYSMKKTSVF